MLPKSRIRTYTHGFSPAALPTELPNSKSGGRLINRKPSGFESLKQLSKLFRCARPVNLPKLEPRGENRTHDPNFTKVPLWPLSYGGIKIIFLCLGLFLFNALKLIVRA